MITQKELIQRGWAYNAFTYRDNGEADLTTEEVDVLVDEKDVDTNEVDTDGNAIFERIKVYEKQMLTTGHNVIKIQDKVEEYVKHFFIVDYWKNVVNQVANPLFDADAESQEQLEFIEESKLELATINVSDLLLVAKLDLIRTTKMYFGLIVDTKDGFKVQIKKDLNLITPTVFSTESLGNKKFDFTYEDLEEKFEELTSLKLED